VRNHSEIKINQGGQGGLVREVHDPSQELNRPNGRGSRLQHLPPRHHP
jgi:hypothetical protein